MSNHTPTRTFFPIFRGGFALAVALLAPVLASSQPQGHQPAPIERREPNGSTSHPSPQPRFDQQAGMVPGHPAKNQQHLADWMEAHRGLPLAQQQSALESEPGFRNLNPQEQQRMHAQLQRLSSMPLQQQQRVIARTEAMERLAPAQRQQIRGAAAQLGSLPPERRRIVANAFHTAMQMPENQRQAWLNSPQNRSVLNDQERGTLNNLIEVAPAARQAGLPWFTPRPAAPAYSPPQY